MPFTDANMLPTTKYARVSTSSDQESDIGLVEKHGQERRSRLLSRHLFGLAPFVALFLLGLAIGLVLPRYTFSSGTHIHNHHVQPSSSDSSTTEVAPLKSCGSSREEALSLGCHFDIWASTWDLPACHHPSLLDEMIAERNMTWYRDGKHTIQVPEEVVYSGDFDIIYPDPDYHISHCLYMWKKFHTAVLRKAPMDEDIWSYNHTLHCVKLLTIGHIPEGTVTLTAPGFPVCGVSE